MRSVASVDATPAITSFRDSSGAIATCTRKGRIQNISPARTTRMSKVGDCISWQGVNKVCSGVVEQRINEQTVLVRLPNNKYIQVYDCDYEHRTIEVSVSQSEGVNTQYEVR